MSTADILGSYHLSITLDSIIYFFQKCYNETLSVFLRNSYKHCIFSIICINIRTIFFFTGIFSLDVLYCSLVLLFLFF